MTVEANETGGKIGVGSRKRLPHFLRQHSDSPWMGGSGDRILSPT